MNSRKCLLCCLICYFSVRGTDAEKINLAFDLYEPATDSKVNYPPIILLHGFMDSRRSWKFVAQPIADKTGRMVYALDVRNHGDSLWTDEISMDIMVDDLEDFFALNNISQAIIVGHSIGGRIVQSFALKQPDKVEKLIVEEMSMADMADAPTAVVGLIVRFIKKAISTIPPDADEEIAINFVKAYFLKKIPAAVIPTTWLELAPIYRKNGTITWQVNLDVLEQSIYLGAMRNNLTGTYEGSTLFLYGTKSFLQVEKDELVKYYFPSTELLGFSGAYHLLHQEMPQDFIREVSRFITGVITPSAQCIKMKLAYEVTLPPGDTEQNLPPIILLHGRLYSRTNWSKVYAVDLRNHGESPWTDEMDFDVLADDLDEFLDDHGIRKACLVGHSLGGRTSITMALRKPQKIEKIVVEDMDTQNYSTLAKNSVLHLVKLLRKALDVIPPGADELQAKESVFNFIQSLLPKDTSKKRSLYDLETIPIKKDGKSYAWQANLDVLETMLASGKDQKLSGIYMGDALFLHGTRSFFQVDKDEKIREYFPRAKLVPVEGAGHLIHHDYPERFLDEVCKFIKSR
ncbi:uncharacterized protein LOC129217151 [Uloborus diversus]|uniref:uncharacterized protein LOC129217151 n=1 Tax=Uloborus diversus TaxID=327109 RepID=UPI002409109C|nr:uncharacterized protein LOC129217151 [Uloborus diversus]